MHVFTRCNGTPSRSIGGSRPNCNGEGPTGISGTRYHMRRASGGARGRVRPRRSHLGAAPEAIGDRDVARLVEARPTDARAARATVHGCRAADEAPVGRVALLQRRALGASCTRAQGSVSTAGDERATPSAKLGPRRVPRTVNLHGEARRRVAVVVQRDEGVLAHVLARDRVHPHAACVARAAGHTHRTAGHVVLPRRAKQQRRARHLAQPNLRVVRGVKGLHVETELCRATARARLTGGCVAWRPRSVARTVAEDERLVDPRDLLVRIEQRPPAQAASH